MKRILLTAVSLGALGLMSPALGADLPTYTKAPVAPTYDWSGFYIGVFGGGGFGNNNVNNATGGATPLANYTANFASQGGMGGGEFGYNFQSGLLVVGGEAQGFWSSIKGSDATGFNSGLYPGVAAIDANQLRWGGSLVVRTGLTVDRLMLFFTGGWAFGDIQHTNTAVPPIPGFSVVDQFTAHGNGLTAGGGLAFAITNNLIGKIEYKYYNFNTYSSHGTPFTANGQLPYTVESTYSTVTLGLDYKFGGPVVARY